MTELQYADPAALRRTAAGLKHRAEGLAYQSQRLDREIESMSFEGFAATQLRSRMLEHRKSALRMAGELLDLANTLLRSAARIEEQIASMGMVT